MEQATFVQDDGTNEWRYKNFYIRQVEDDYWELKFGKILTRYDSIYHLINIFFIN